MTLTAQEAATGLPSASPSLDALQWALPLLAAIPVIVSGTGLVVSYTPSDWQVFGDAAAAWGVITGLCVTVFPRGAVRGLYRKPLSLVEIDALLPEARTDIDRAYLELMRAAVEQPVPPDAEAGLRDALRALGRAADSLPPAIATPRDTSALRQQAATARAQADQEQDEVVAASWERQADALERQASALDRAHVVTRRGQALRAEVLAQMAALQAGLADFRLDAAPNTALLSALSENARRVADEASHVAQARAELEEFVAAPKVQDAPGLQGAIQQTGRQ